MRKVVVVVGLSALVAACGGSGPSSAPRRHVTTAVGPNRGQAIAAPLQRSCIIAAGYGGLGADENDFDANNNNSTGPAGPTPGAAWYQITATDRGCIAGYSVQDSATPPLGTRDMLDLISRSYLPRDAQQVANGPGCVIWRSFALGRAIGLTYAKATAIPQLGAIMPGGAEVEATSDPSC